MQRQRQSILQQFTAGQRQRSRTAGGEHPRPAHHLLQRRMPLMRQQLTVHQRRIRRPQPTVDQSGAELFAQRQPDARMPQRGSGSHGDAVASVKQQVFRHRGADPGQATSIAAACPAGPVSFSSMIGDAER